MKVERNVFGLSPEKRKWNGNMEMKICKTEIKTDFFGGNGNKNGTMFSSGTDMKTEFPLSTNMEFPF
jgi:hypothetical protein